MLQIVRKLISGRRPAPMDRVESEILEIERLGIFDRQAYLQAYPDVAAAGIEPIRHYVTQGIREGRNPCMFFDTAYYYGSHPDVAKAGLNPLLHYFEFGWSEGRNPSADFDGTWYARTHLASANGRINPLLHYLGIGRGQGLETRPVADPDAETVRESGIFDADYYLEQYPDIA
jgi:hypothetical protein